jgi:hypothetical protein
MGDTKWHPRIQPANTLGAEVDLGALATVLRKRKDGTPITDSDELIKCSNYGNKDRNSDPTVGVFMEAQSPQHPDEASWSRSAQLSTRLLVVGL